MKPFDPLKSLLITKIRETVKNTEPDAEIILYGSRARGDFNENSDYDLLILVKKEKLSYADEQKLRNPLYDIELESGKLISLTVLPWTVWHTRHKGTQFYENIAKEGVRVK